MTQSNPTTSRSSPPRAGAAMIMVTIALAVSGVIAASLLSANALRARAAANAVDATRAHFLAESGVNVALFYLQYPERYTGAKPAGYYPGQEPVPLGSGFEGSVTTTVTYDTTTKLYSIASTAALPRSEHTYSRRLDAVTEVISSTTTVLDPIADGLVTNADTTLKPLTTIVGNVKSLGNLTLSGATVIGSVGSDRITLSGLASVTGTLKSLATSIVEDDPVASADADVGLLRDGLTSLVPPLSALPDLRRYQVVDNMGIAVAYNALSVTDATLSATTLEGNAVTNPRSVFSVDHSSAATVQVLRIDGTVRINGSLLLRNTEVLLSPGATLQVFPQPGMPAVVSDQSIRMSNNSNFIVDGLVRAERIRTESAGANAVIGVNGALLLSAASNPLPSATDSVGAVAIAYNKSKAQVPGFGTVRPPAFARGVKVVAWSD